MDAVGNRYRRCTQCHTWFSRHKSSTCTCNTAQYCSRECQAENWPVHKVNCTREHKQRELNGTPEWLIPPKGNEIGLSKSQLMAILNSPEFETNHNIAMAKAGHVDLRTHPNSKEFNVTQVFTPAPREYCSSSTSSQVAKINIGQMPENMGWMLDLLSKANHSHPWK